MQTHGHTAQSQQENGPSLEPPKGPQRADTCLGLRRLCATSDPEGVDYTPGWLVDVTTGFEVFVLGTSAGDFPRTSPCVPKAESARWLSNFSANERSL